MERLQSTSEGSPLPTSEGSSLPTRRSRAERRIRRGRFDPTRPVTPTTGQCWLSDVPVIRGRTPSSSSEPPAPQERTLLEQLRLRSGIGADTGSVSSTDVTPIIRHDARMQMRHVFGSDAYTGSPPGSLISDGSPFVSFIDLGTAHLEGSGFPLGDPSPFTCTRRAAEFYSPPDPPIPGVGSHIQTFSS